MSKFKRVIIIIVCMFAYVIAHFIWNVSQENNNPPDKKSTPNYNLYEGDVNI